MARKKEHLLSLEASLQEEPSSLIARLREAIPLIEASLQAGHSLRSIHRRLNDAGFAIAYNTLATYRRRLKQSNRAVAPKKPVGIERSLEVRPHSEPEVVAEGGFDPAVSFRKHASKQVKWEYPSGRPNENKLVHGENK